mmetsp:Transcript_23637/g.89768  ORF Transcript_23637/g.89768 Transcript_23637/m.89768 type:complete len:208 (+) Transcript_23637:421-1044(+)
MPGSRCWSCRLALVRSGGCLAHGLGGGLLGLVEGVAVDLALRLEALHEVAVLPSHGVGEVAELAEVAAGAELKDAEGLGHDHALHLVERGGDALESLQAGHGGSAPRSLVRDHATDGTPEHAGRGAEVHGAAAARVGVPLLVEELVELGLVAVQRAGDVHLLSAHADDLLAAQELLGDDGRQAAEQVPAAVDHDDLLEHDGRLPSTR